MEAAEADPDISEIEQAARNIGVAPGDPAWAFVAALCRDLTERRRLDAEQRREMAAILEEARARPAAELAPEIAGSLSAEVGRLLARQWLWLNRRALVWAALAGAAILLLGGVGGYWAGYRHGGSDAIRAVDDIRAAVADGAPAAMAWRELIRWNAGNIRQSLRNCANIRTDGPRRACDLPVWIGPAS
jgi:hypothetical protein